MKHTATFLLITAMALSICLTGCMSGGNVGETVNPTPTADFMPNMNNRQTQESADYDWKANAAKVEANIGRISEIAECRVVITGNTALVGVKFDNSYKGEMTERLRQMVAAEVLAADPKIETVAVTAYPDDVEDVYELSDRMLSGKDQDDLKEEINEIVRNATTLR